MNRRAVETAFCLVAAALAIAALYSRISAVGSLSVDAYRDDAWYYFDFVRNLCSGRGPVVGDGPPTNGVQILWVALLAPLWWIGGDPFLVEGARFVGLACLIAGAAVLARGLAREGLPARLALGGGLLVLGQPLLVIEAQNGQESGLAVLVTALLLGARSAGPERFVLCGVCAVLTRPELLLLVVLLAVLRDGRLLRRAIAPCVAAAAYAATNFVLAGHITPDAGWPTPFMAHTKFADTDPDLGRWLGQLWWWGRPCLLGGPFRTAATLGSAALAALAAPRWLGPTLARIGFVLLLSAVLLGRNDFAVPLGAFAMLACAPSRDPALVRTARVCLLAALGIVVLHDLVRWSPRDYYFVPIAVLCVWALARIVKSSSSRAVLMLSGALLVAGIVTLGEAPRRFPWQANLRLAAECLGTLLDESPRIGAFNAGILAFHSERRVVNLDGVVNPRAFSALRRGELPAYLDAEHIDWLCDDPREVALGADLHARGPFLMRVGDARPRLTALASFTDLGVRGQDLEGFSEAVVLYRRDDAPGAGVRELPDFVDLGERPGLGRVVGVRSRDGQQLDLAIESASAMRLPRDPVASWQFFALPSAPAGRGVRLLRGAQVLLEYR